MAKCRANVPNVVVEEQFEVLAQAALDQADSIRCSLQEYRDGLVTIRDTFDAAIIACDESIENADLGDVEPAE